MYILLIVFFHVLLLFLFTVIHMVVLVNLHAWANNMHNEFEWRTPHIYMYIPQLRRKGNRLINSKKKKQTESATRHFSDVKFRYITYIDLYYVNRNSFDAWKFLLVHMNNKTQVWREKNPLEQCYGIFLHQAENQLNRICVFFVRAFFCSLPILTSKKGVQKNDNKYLCAVISIHLDVY